MLTLDQVAVALKALESELHSKVIDGCRIGTIYLEMRGVDNGFVVYEWVSAGRSIGKTAQDALLSTLELGETVYERRIYESEQELRDLLKITATA